MAVVSTPTGCTASVLVSRRPVFTRNGADTRRVCLQATPKAKNRAHEARVFYTMPEYESWKEEVANPRGWSIKYYKGLGTSTSKEAKEYFSELDHHRKTFIWEGAWPPLRLRMGRAERRRACCAWRGRRRRLVRCAQSPLAPSLRAVEAVGAHACRT
jgi:C-terminal associated domain of TOPRIM